MNGDNEAGGFILVPLPLLATGWDMKVVMQYALAYSAERLAIALEENEDIAENQEPTDLYARAIDKIGFRFGSVPSEELPSHVQRKYKFIEELLRNYAETNPPKWAKIYGTIPRGIALSLAKGECPENRGRVLIAIASQIGKKPYARAGWKAIMHRAAGYVWDPKKFRLPGGTQDCPRPQFLSRTQVDYQLNALRKLNLVESFTYKRGKRYWCFPGRCTREEMARRVILKQIATQREPDSELTARIEAELSLKS